MFEKVLSHGPYINRFIYISESIYVSEDSFIYINIELPFIDHRFGIKKRPFCPPTLAEGDFINGLIRPSVRPSFLPSYVRQSVRRHNLVSASSSTVFQGF